MTITINPKNKKELAKIKTILKAIEVDFIESEDSYDKDFVLKIEKSRKEISKGETKKIALDDLWK
ncbi:hypothetical protein NG800_004345 [Epilithonimonas ginsengisoli]|uniref:Uncharacterized protein n=1 Tax=Epilithonimonas ginsengisoli TaxID=1245592 RepID=A0ABU4JEM6_9FLAO|nr:MULTISPECIES: DUF2683 family protein [Chryseobacterium group]MBO6200281.1 hypothetical protein [Chryseobacterium sp.]MBV6879491.1 hypothetical protein [Epilithonimonas sp. FP105]MDW8548127.1 hypothetical protein [Epilithonimonas ginsengisoli]OAH64435.1 hypothetical protein AXA65_18925 [Chryseobacterium sp. FP211-J200]